jgi:DnaK suppressor protein
MDLHTQTHLKPLRDWLLYRRSELEAEVHAAELARREPRATAEHEVSDQKDAAADEQQADIAQAQEQRDLDELAQVQAALTRLDQGRYGDCVDCGESISLARLTAQPAALRCATCQTAHEVQPPR